MPMAGNLPPVSEHLLPPASDDLQCIRGIGPATEKRLQRGGITTYAQLAALPVEALSALLGDLPAMTPERIARHDWPGEARRLLAQSAAEDDAGAAANHQRYATFTVELLLEAGAEVRRTRVTHVQSGAQETWAARDDGRLLGFVLRCAELPRPEEPAAVLPAAPSPEGPVPAPGAPSPAGALPLAELAIRPGGTGEPCRFLTAGQAFQAILHLDATQVTTVRQGGGTAYRIQLRAQPLGGGPLQTVGEAVGVSAAGAPLDVCIESEPLPPGPYRLKVGVTLGPAGAPPEAGPALSAALDGGILVVHPR